MSALPDWLATILEEHFNDVEQPQTIADVIRGLVVGETELEDDDEISLELLNHIQKVVEEAKANIGAF